MNGWEQFAAAWFAWIVASTWQLALLVVLVAVATRALRSASPRLRYGLWLLVLIKVFLPPGLTAPWSVGVWGARPLAATTSTAPTDQDGAPQATPAAAVAAGADFVGAIDEIQTTPAVSVPLVLMMIWAAGGIVCWGAVCLRYAQVARLVRAGRWINDGPALGALEQIATALGLRRVPELVSTSLATSPFLFGVLRPRIVVSAALLERLDEMELRAVLTHELVHCQRRDTSIGWLQVVATSLFWFHPGVWWANRQLRHERECVCDDAVLRLGRVTPQEYTRSIFHVLALSRGRSLAAGSLVGVFERGAKLQNRLEDVMNYSPARGKSIWLSRVVLVMFAAFLLPMAPGRATSRSAEAAEPRPAANQTTVAGPTEAAKPPLNQTVDLRTALPQIVKTVPISGATDVDPATAEISITFDRDMGKGMSWTGGAPLFPPTDDTKKARWTDARTCVLPVKLEKGAYYRVGVNSSSYRNFRGADGAMVQPTMICFATKGASDEVAARVRAPKIVKLSPENGAQDVDPATASLSVTFDAPMGEGMSWTGNGPNYPESPDGAKATWSADRRTCTLPVKLAAGHSYQLSLNGPMHNNFQSEWGVQTPPVVYRFQTRAAE